MVSTLGGYLGFLGLLAAERLVELVLSKRNAARAFARGGVETGQDHYRVMVVLHSLFLVACGAEVVGLSRPFPGAPGLGALGVALVAQALR
ncbi:MAG TPA: hypothetical protein VGB96_11140, partial [Archangium sp.]